MKKLIGAFATIALLGSGAAFANDDKNKPQQDPSSAQGGSGAAGSGSQQTDPALGGSGSTQSEDPALGGSGAAGSTQSDPALGGSGAAGSTQSDPALGGSGSAMGSQGAAGQKELTGKVVKASKKMVWVDHNGAVVPLKVDNSTQFGDPNLKRAADLQVGQEIRASYEVKETDNVAKSISMSGTGGSGSGDVMSPDSSINQGAGGSGTGLEEDKGLDTGSGVDTPPITDPGTGTTGSGTGGSGDTGTMNPNTGGSSTSPDPQ